MNNPIAVLRRMLQHRFAWTDGEEGIAALDHAIAAIAERDALVARLGEAIETLRDGGSVVPSDDPYLRGIRDGKRTAITLLDDLARVVKEAS